MILIVANLVTEVIGVIMGIGEIIPNMTGVTETIVVIIQVTGKVIGV